MSHIEATNAMRRTGQYKPLIIPAFINYLPFLPLLSRAVLTLFLVGTSTTSSRTSKYSLLNILAGLATTCGWDPFHSGDDCPHPYPPVNEGLGDR